MKKFIVLYILFFFTFLNSNSQNIIINEIMSSNESSILDKDGDSSDWLEIYNSSNQILNLENFSISDDIKSLDKWKFPSIEIYPQNFLLIFCSGKDILDINELHTSFKINQSGEQLFLVNNKKQIISSTPAVYIPKNQSFGSVIDGDSIRDFFIKPSPGSSNTLSNPIYFSHSSGFYSTDFHLELLSNVKNNQIYYTIDGSIPNHKSLLYNNPILITNNNNYNISLIPTTVMDGPDRINEYIWQLPKNIPKVSIIRFASFKNDTIQTPVYSNTYFVGDKYKSRYSFPILSLITDSVNLFDYETGIYIPGKTFDEEGFGWWPSGNYHNRGYDWERDVYISYFDKERLIGFETDAGMRIRGYGSAVFPQKSLNIYFREEYNFDKINYPIFSNENPIFYKRLILRNSGNDFLSTHFRDALLQDLLKPLNLETQHFAPSVVFINGEYWGLHNIREKYDKYYFKYRFDIDEENLNLISYCGYEVEEGSADNYFEIENFVYENDISIDENYNFLKNEIDIENFIDFIISEIYYANYDWPCNNYKIWKTNDENSKWRFLIYDLDWSFGYNERSSYNTPSLEHATYVSDGWPHCGCSNIFFRKMLENNEFQDQFLDKFLYHLKNTFDSELLINKINEYKTLFESEIEEHINRWGYPRSISNWIMSIEDLKFFAVNRPCFMKKNIMNYFNLENFDFQCEELKLEDYEISTFPNPNNGFFTLLINFPITNGAKIIVSNLSGKIVYEEQNYQQYNSYKNLDLNFLKTGLYIVNIKTDQISLKSKILITK
tara:strand:+ start:1371 stop:3704 length:2334 start_codon:yes stop_codon:yes gene_type:complete